MYKNMSLRENADLFSSVFKKIIPNHTTSTFQEKGGVTQLQIFCRMHNIFSRYRADLHKIDFYSQCILTLLFTAVNK